MDLKQVLKSVEERSSGETPSQLKQLKRFLWLFLVSIVHSGEKFTWKSRCVSVNKLHSSSCCILGQNLSWSVLLEKVAKAINFEAQIKGVLVKRKLRFQADFFRVSRVYLGKAKPIYNLIVHFTCMCLIRLSLTGYKLDSGVLNNCHEILILISQNAVSIKNLN